MIIKKPSFQRAFVQSRESNPEGVLNQRVNSKLRGCEHLAFYSTLFAIAFCRHIYTTKITTSH